MASSALSEISFLAESVDSLEEFRIWGNAYGLSASLVEGTAW
jgi:hypothetical protein